MRVAVLMSTYNGENYFQRLAHDVPENGFVTSRTVSYCCFEPADFLPQCLFADCSFHYFVPIRSASLFICMLCGDR